jgi:hypothetical protein
MGKQEAQLFGTIRYHDLKTWTEFYKEVEIGNKNFEVRKNDRDYQTGDYLILREYNKDTNEYTGKKLFKRITYILNNENLVLKNTIIMSIIDGNNYYLNMIEKLSK